MPNVFIAAASGPIISISRGNSQRHNNKIRDHEVPTDFMVLDMGEEDDI